jgi:hypothetical protein
MKAKTLIAGLAIAASFLVFAPSAQAAEKCAIINGPFLIVCENVTVTSVGGGSYSFTYEGEGLGTFAGSNFNCAGAPLLGVPAAWTCGGSDTLPCGTPAIVRTLIGVQTFEASTPAPC